jgi:hypothetical protein
MALRFEQYVITLSGSAQQLSTVIGANKRVRSITMQPGATNANPIYVGDAAVSATAYAVRLPAASSSEPPAPFQIDALGDLTLPDAGMNLADVYVIGTASQKLHVGIVRY